MTAAFDDPFFGTDDEDDDEAQMLVARFEDGLHLFAAPYDDELPIEDCGLLTETAGGYVDDTGQRWQTDGFIALLDTTTGPVNALGVRPA